MNYSEKVSNLLNNLSQIEGNAAGSDELLPEHLILAILKNNYGSAFFVLQRLNIDISDFRVFLENNLVTKPKSELNFILPSSRRLNQLMDLAVMEAEALNSSIICTEHIILAAMRESDSLTQKYFQQKNIDISLVREEARKIPPEQKERTKKPVILQDYIFPDLIAPKKSQSENAINIPLSDSAKKQSVKYSVSETPTLDQYTRDLTKSAKQNNLDPVVGREKEIESVIQILSRRLKNNPVLTGEPGVGKTAIVEGLAQKISSSKVPYSLLNKKVLSLDLTALVAGTRYRGDFEERMKKILDEVKSKKNIILFIDEFHSIIGAGGQEGQMDVSNILKPALSRGEVQIIGATTTKEYTKYIEKDAALERRFQVVKVSEPSEEECVAILSGIKVQYEKFHHVFYSEEVIENIVKLSKRYIPEKFLPDKAIDLLDEAGAFRKIQEENHPAELEELEKEINLLDKERQNLVKEQKYEEAAVVRDKVLELKHKLEIYVDFWNEKSPENYSSVTLSDVFSVINRKTGIPLDQLDSSEVKRLSQMKQILSESVIGQNEAISTISNAIKRSRMGISSPNRPIGSFIFLGPTGVGKTKLAKSLAKFLFGSEDKLIRIDMSDYMEKHNSSRLVGAPPGYVGFEEGGVLTEKVRKNPYSIILLDEIEKSHPDIFNLLLQVLEEGELSDNLGHTVNFRNTILIMTSNAGAKQITNEGKVGFLNNSKDVLSKSEIESTALKEIKKFLSPEFINRLDDIVIFNPLEKQTLQKIVDIQVEELKERLAQKKLSLKISQNAKDLICQKGYEPSMGARPLRRVLQKEVEDKIANLLLNSQNPSSTILVDADEEKIFVKFEDLNQNEEILNKESAYEDFKNKKY